MIRWIHELKYTSSNSIGLQTYCELLYRWYPGWLKIPYCCCATSWLHIASIVNSLVSSFNVIISFQKRHGYLSWLLCIWWQCKMITKVLSILIDEVSSIVDCSVFKTNNMETAESSNNCVLTVGDYIYNQRIIITLQYYNTWGIGSNTSDNELFFNFVNLWYQ